VLCCVDTKLMMLMRSPVFFQRASASCLHPTSPLSDLGQLGVFIFYFLFIYLFIHYLGQLGHAVGVGLAGDGFIRDLLDLLDFGFG